MTTIKIIEVSPRDGLQNEKKIVSVEDKIHFIELLSECGFTEIEAGAFVSPKWVPQMADTGKVFDHFKGIKRGIVYSALVPNEKGMEAAIAAGVKKIALFTAASETFNQKNINCSIEESLKRFQSVVRLAQEYQISIRGYVSTAFVCPYEGLVAPHKVLSVVDALVGLGVTEISVGDTIGAALPEHVDSLLTMLLKKYSPQLFTMHFHDTYDRALMNIAESIRFKISCFDSSAGGLGGCPYAPGAKGNVSTNAVIDFLESQGFTTGIDRHKLQKACAFIDGVVR